MARSPLRAAGLAADPLAPTPTPRYTEIPRWGLRDSIEKPSDRRNWPELFADRAALLLIVTAGFYVLAAVAEIGRYAILVRNRTRLIDPGLLSTSDIAVFFTQAGGLFLALIAAGCAVCGLLRIRRRTFALEKRTDPRTPAEVVVGCAVPVLNLVMPGVFLLEVIRRDPRAVTLVRAWWISWVFGAALVLFNWYWRSRPTLQAMADGVLLSAFTALVAAVTAVLALLVLRRLEGRTVTGRKQVLTRWVPVTEPATGQKVLAS